MSPIGLPIPFQRGVSLDRVSRSCLEETLKRRFRLASTACMIGYSITSSARMTRLGGTVMPSALAALRLITRSRLRHRQPVNRAAGDYSTLMLAFLITGPHFASSCFM